MAGKCFVAKQNHNRVTMRINRKLGDPVHGLVYSISEPSKPRLPYRSLLREDFPQLLHRAYDPRAIG